MSGSTFVKQAPPRKRHPFGWLFCFRGGPTIASHLVSATSRSGNRFAFPPQSASSLLVSGKARNIGALHQRPSCTETPPNSINFRFVFSMFFPRRYCCFFLFNEATPTCIKTSTRLGANRLTFDVKYGIINSPINKNLTKEMCNEQQRYYKIFLRSGCLRKPA